MSDIGDILRDCASQLQDKDAWPVLEKICSNDKVWLRVSEAIRDCWKSSDSDSIVGSKKRSNFTKWCSRDSVSLDRVKEFLVLTGNKADVGIVNYSSIVINDIEYKEAGTTKDLINKLIKDGVDFSGANLTCLDLVGISFEGINFRDTNFNGSKLAYCSFINCDLRGASIKGCHMHNTWIDNCLLTGLKFYGATVFKDYITNNGPEAWESEDTTISYE